MLSSLMAVSWQKVPVWPAILAEHRAAKSGTFPALLARALNPPAVHPPSAALAGQKVDPPLAQTSSSNGQGAGVQRTTGLTVAQADEFRRAAHEWYQLVMSIDRGEFGTARPRLEKMVLSRPQNIPLAVTLMDVDLEMGDYEAVLQLAAPYVRSNEAGRDLLLRASLATTMLGQVYRGEKEFIQGFNTTDDPKDELMRFLPAGDSAEELAALAAHNIACHQHGPEQALRFLAVSLRFDPSNPLFAEEAAGSFITTFQYTKAIDVLTPALERAKKLTFLGTVIPAELARARFCLEKYGDGRPSWPVPTSPPTARKSADGTIHP